MTAKTDITKAPKLYRNGKTYAQNVADGTFIPVKHLQNHKEVMAEVKELKDMLANITQHLTK